MNSKQFVPEKESGKNIDLNFHVDCPDSEHATLLYTKAVTRLKDPDNWAKLNPAGTTKFELIKPGQKSGMAAPGDYIRINVPGPGSQEGEGYDYVQIVRLNDSGSSTGEPETYMQLRPCSNPASGSDKIAHFFDESSSSSFVLSLNGNRVMADYFGRNETINKHDTSLIDTVRNTIVGVGALAGMSENQWKGLLQGLLSQTSNI